MSCDTGTDVAGHAEGFRSGCWSARDVAVWTLDRIDRNDGDLRAMTYVDPDLVLAQAAHLDARRRAGEEIGGLAGVPVVIKDLFDVEGLPTSYNSPTYPPTVARGDASCVARLRRAGALIVGKSRTSEFAWSPDTPPTANPADHTLSPSGSSGGSAAAVGGGLVPVGLGTDTGGSIRCPAALCGIVGLKPTYGIVSLSGVLPNCWALDHAGPLTRNVNDARLVLSELVGHDPQYPYSAPAHRVDPLRDRLSRRVIPQLRDLRLGVVEDPLFEIVDGRAQSAFDGALESVKASGVALPQVRIPELRFVQGTLMALSLGSTALFTDVLRRDPDGFAQEDVKAAFNIGHFIPAVLVQRAAQARRRIAEVIATTFRDHNLDGLLAPAAVAPAGTKGDLDAVLLRRNGEPEPVFWGGHPRPFYLANLTGQPSIVIPIVNESPPLGIQVIGRPYRDDALLAIGEALEPLFPVSPERPANPGAESRHTTKKGLSR
jgi:aspartyl-tRNA(Asn)/glutamyl-tRNA(Gln) amidotransferase subunit A